MNPYHAATLALAALAALGFLWIIAILIRYARQPDEAPRPAQYPRECHIRRCGRTAYFTVQRADTGEYEWCCTGCHDEGVAWGWWANTTDRSASRLATNKQNHENRPGAQANSTSGVRGVSWHKAAGKWRARVKHFGIEHHLGLFESKDQAEAAAIAKRNELYTHNSLDRRAS